MMESQAVFINGKWEKGEGEAFVSFNSATNRLIWEGRAASKNQVVKAVEKGSHAFKEWSITPFDQRVAFLTKYAEILEKSKFSLADTFSKETGKPLWDSLNEVEAMVNKIPLSFEAYGKRCPSLIKDQSKGKSFTRHKPHGLLAVFGPYNFPGHLPNGHIVPALLAGNTIILKPSELAPLSAEKMMECLIEAEFPKGVVQLLQGGRSTGEALYKNESLAGLLFTGSYETGKLLAEYFGKFPSKILALEMGGNNPLVIDQIDNSEAAAYLTIQSAFITSGQRCTCARRLILVDSTENRLFLEKLKLMIESIVVGAYTDLPEPFMGPVISPSHAVKLLEQQEFLVRQGGTSLIQMKLLQENSAFLSPGLIDVTAIKNRSDNEIFGPLLQLIYVQNLEEAIEIANQTQFGLSAGIFTNSREHYLRFLHQINAGVVNWNVQLTGASSAAPFGGIKASGNLRPSAFYAADYCSYPIASLEKERLEVPIFSTPGIAVNKRGSA